MKKCCRCKEDKPIEFFYRNARSKDGRNAACGDCIKKAYRHHYQENKAEIIATTKQYYLDNKDRRRAHYKQYYEENKLKICERLRRIRPLIYGLTIEQFDEMMLNQGGMCAICDRERKLNIDHDHTTGKVRSLLCMPCNQAIGLLQESQEVITKAAEYIKKHSAA